MASRTIALLTALGSLLLLGGLSLLFALLFRTEITEPGGWFVEPAVYTMIPWGKALGWALFFSVCGSVFLYPALARRLHYRNAIGRYLENGRFGSAWELAVRFDEFDRIETHLRDKIHLGKAGAENAVLEALEHLRRLRASASDALNRALTDDLRGYATRHAERGLSVLGQIVERLILLHRQGIDPAKLSDRLENIRQSIVHLAEATEAARVHLANLSLGAERDQMAEEASALMRQVGRVAEELHQFDNAMSGWESPGSIKPGATAE